MDDRELAKRVKSLSKAVANSEPTSTIISMMDSLRKDSAPTEEMLRVSLPALHTVDITHVDFLGDAMYCCFCSTTATNTMTAGDQGWRRRRQAAGQLGQGYC